MGVPPRGMLPRHPNPFGLYDGGINKTSWEGPSRMGLVQRILELGHFMLLLHLVVTHFKHFIKSNYFCSPSTIG